MGSEFSFYDYVDDAGNNIIRSWLDGLPKKPRAKFKKWLLNLEGLPHGQWSRPMVDTLDGYCQGLFEVRVSLGRQYRILGAHMGATPILLHCFIKPEEQVEDVECDRAFVRLAEVGDDPGKHRTRHEYDD